MKKLFVILPMVLCFMISCQDKQALAELENLRAKSKLESDNKAVIEKYLQAWNNKNLKIFDELCDPQFKQYLPSITSNPSSLEGAKRFSEAVYLGFPDVNYGIQGIYAVGDKVIVWWICSGTHDGEFNGIPATGNKVRNSAIEIYTLKNGKIIEERAEVDAVTFNQQLGI